MDRLREQLCAAVRCAVAGDRITLREAGFGLWQAFVALSGARRCGSAGPEAIRFSEIEAWARLKRVPLKPRHVDFVTAMDAAWLEACGTTLATPATPTRPSGPLSPAMFDAVFG